MVRFSDPSAIALVALSPAARHARLDQRRTERSRVRRPTVSRRCRWRRSRSRRFWAPRLEVNRTRTLDHVLKEIESTGGLSNFDIAAGKAKGKFGGPFWADSDVYKWIEGASWTLAKHPDPALDAKVDALIARIAAAQQPDGYLDTFVQINVPELKLQELRVLPRGLLVRPPLRSRGGALSGNGQEDAAHGRDADGRRLRPRVRAGQEGLHPGTRRHRAGARQAVARHRREALLRSGEGDARSARPEAIDLRGPVQAARRQPHGRLPRQAPPHRRVVRALLPEGSEALRHALRAGPRAGARAEGSGRPRRAGDVPVLRDGRRGARDERPGSVGRLEGAARQRDAAPDVRHRRDRAVGAQRRLHGGLRPAERERLSGDLRLGGDGALEPPAAQRHRRREVHRRHGAVALQRRRRRRVAHRRSLLLRDAARQPRRSSPARPGSACPAVRRRSPASCHRSASTSTAVPRMGSG